MNPPQHPTPALELITLPAGTRGATALARNRAHQIGRNFRAPHHTASAAAMGSEVAVAAGGVLYLDEPEEISRPAAHMIYSTVKAMHPDARPVVILAIREFGGGIPLDARDQERRVERLAQLYGGWRISAHTVIGADKTTTRQILQPNPATQDTERRRDDQFQCAAPPGGEQLFRVVTERQRWQVEHHKNAGGCTGRVDELEGSNVVACDNPKCGWSRVLGVDEPTKIMNPPQHPAPVTMDRNEAIKRIRQALLKRSKKSWSVTGGRGTAWGWITVQAPPRRRTSNFDGTAPGDHTTPKERAELAALLGLESIHHQGCNIAASSHYYREYVDRAEGREPSVRGEPYWD